MRSQLKGQQLLCRYTPDVAKRISTIIVEDITKEGAFDQALQAAPFDVVIHCASPFYYRPNNPEEDMLRPAIRGTVGILESVKKRAPSVKRVIITSSFAAIINFNSHPPVYSEKVWNPVTYEQALNPALSYPGSKKLAEEAAWAFMRDEQPSFALTTICPPLVYGPVANRLDSLDNINTSNSRIRDIILGKFSNAIPPTMLYLWVDVRDVAHAHVQAIDIPEAANERFLVTAGHYDNKVIVEIIREEFPQLKERLPSRDLAGDLPTDVYKFDNSKSVNLLGVNYQSLRVSVRDTVATLLEQGNV